MTDHPISDKDLQDIYLAGYTTTHIDGLRAVWAAALKSVVSSQSLPTPPAETMAGT